MMLTKYTKRDVQQCPAKQIKDPNEQGFGGHNLLGYYRWWIPLSLQVGR